VLEKPPKRRLFIFCRWLSGRDLRPLHFNAPVQRLQFSYEDVMQPLPTSNPMLA
jgi:hypothetical protein